MLFYITKDNRAYKTDITFIIKTLFELLSFCYQIGNLRTQSPVFIQGYATLVIIPIPQLQGVLKLYQTQRGLLPLIRR